MFRNIRFDFFDHARLVADLADSAEEIVNTRARYKHVSPPYAFLRRLGKDMLNATNEDHGALRLRREVQSTERLLSRSFGRAFCGVLEFNWLMAAVILARDDLSDKFGSDGKLSFDKGLQWLILHGLSEHRLWHIVSPVFINELTEREIPGTDLTVLQLMLLREQPALRRLFGSGDPVRDKRAFTKWLIDRGSRTYGLFWCLSSSCASRLRRSRTKAHIVDVMAAQRAGVGFQNLLPFGLSHLVLGRTAAPPTPEVIHSAQQRLLLLQNSLENLDVFGSPICFWAGMPGQLTLIGGQFEAPTNRGLPIVSDSFSLILPRLRHVSHTLVIEGYLPNESKSDVLVSCRFNGRWSPVRRVSNAVSSLFVIDASSQPAASPGFDGHMLHLHLGGREATTGPKLVLSRLWAF